MTFGREPRGLASRGIYRLKRLPVRWRLALISASLTFVILALFALVVGVFTARQVHGSFDSELRLTADNLQAQFVNVRPWTGLRPEIPDQMIDAVNTGDAAIRFVTEGGTVIYPADAPDLGPPAGGLHDVNGYRVATRALTDPEGHPYAYLQYAKKLSSVRHTIDRVRIFLVFGVLAGTALALLAGLGLARRAMAPIANLTRAAKDIARTRNPAVSLPKPPADDEVADLARTLEEMLLALDSARSETQAALDRQRQFVADASHELRTPLTSILANLELLEAELSGEDAEIAGSALRSSRRMRRLVADLLLLARADAGRVSTHERVDLADVIREAAGEAMPLAPDHHVSVDVEEVDLVVDGTADELHRLFLNLIQNALLHTPAGTAVEVSAKRSGDRIVATVDDNGPGVPPEMRERIFDRFVRATGDRAVTGGGSGLGLAIVRAVAESHGGTVTLTDSPAGGARFEVSLPAGVPVTEEQQAAEPARHA